MFDDVFDAVVGLALCLAVVLAVAVFRSRPARSRPSRGRHAAPPARRPASAGGHRDIDGGVSPADDVRGAELGPDPMP
jgi:hypothetical protein